MHHDQQSEAQLRFRAVAIPDDSDLEEINVVDINMIVDAIGCSYVSAQCSIFLKRRVSPHRRMDIIV